MEGIDVTPETVARLGRALTEISNIARSALGNESCPEWTCPECGNAFSYADGTRTDTRNGHHRCPLPDAIMRLRSVVHCGEQLDDERKLRKRLECRLDAALADKTEIKRSTTKTVAGRCVVIATQMVPIPGGERNRTWEEITHAIMRELLGWKGM
jgi:hypothetical protein